MLRKNVITVMLIGSFVGCVLLVSPGFRTMARHQWENVTGWSEEDRLADPVGFARHAERKLRRDLDIMQRTRRELATEQGRIDRQIREEQALADFAESLAEDFREQFQLASSSGSFPIEVRHAAYTKEQARTQVSLLLAELEGYQVSLAKLQEVSTQVDKQLESLSVRISATSSQLAALSAQRELLRARQLTIEGEQLLAQVDELMTGNRRLLDGNPVRTVQELANVAPVGKPIGQVSPSHVDAFLTRGAEISSETIPATTTQPVHQITAKPPVQISEPEKPHKPIFEQL